MKQRGITLQAMGEACGVHYSLIARIISGQRRPSPALLWNAASVLKVPYAELLARSGRREDLFQDDSVDDSLIQVAPQTQALAMYVEYAKTPEGQAEIEAQLKPRLSQLRSAELAERLEGLYRYFTDPAARMPARALVGGALLYFIAATETCSGALSPAAFSDQIAVVSLVWNIIRHEHGTAKVI